MWQRCARPGLGERHHLHRTLEGFAYLAVVIDLDSRRMVGWSMQRRQTTDVVQLALDMAVWRRRPRHRVLIHSDPGAQFTSINWAAFTRAHNLERSRIRHDNCDDNVVAGSFSPRSSARESGVERTKVARKLGGMCSSMSRCSTTRRASRSGTGCSRRSRSNGNSFSRRKASRRLKLLS